MNKLRATCPPFNHVVRLDPATKGSHNAGSTGVPSPKERCTGLTFAPVILIVTMLSRKKVSCVCTCDYPRPQRHSVFRVVVSGRSALARVTVQLTFSQNLTICTRKRANGEWPVGSGRRRGA